MNKVKVADAELRKLLAERLKNGETYDEAQQTLRAATMFSNQRFRKVYAELRQEMTGVDFEVVQQNVKLAVAKQREQDMNRIKNKSFREDARLNNAMTACGERIIKILEAYDFSKITVQHSGKAEDAQGIIQLADLHLNELVRTSTNQYDFPTAAKRMQKFAARATEYLLMRGVKAVFVANTGDILNSDRRLDEYMNMATNRMNAAMLAVFLIEQFLVDLNKNFNVTYIQVSGNESRVKDEPGSSDIVLTDNYDALIYNIIKHSMRSAKGIAFRDGNIAEKIINVLGQSVLVLHGENVGSNIIESIQKIKGKYAQQGISVTFAIFGHVHSALVHDHFARSGSMVGANDYSDRGLQTTGGASQNVHVFYGNGEHDSIVISLNNVDGFKGYEIREALIAYNAKSEKKLHTKTPILEIVI